MPPNQPGQIAGLYRYPVKGLSPEQLARVALGVGQTLPADRRYAIENGPSGFDPLAPVWMPKTNFLMLLRNERLAGLWGRFYERPHLLTPQQGSKVPARGVLETAGRRAPSRTLFLAPITHCPQGTLTR